nr:MAG TPA: hypothetical protein [Bacteriophage sp.]
MRTKEMIDISLPLANWEIALMPMFRSESIVRMVTPRSLATCFMRPDMADVSYIQYTFLCKMLLSRKTVITYCNHDMK